MMCKEELEKRIKEIEAVIVQQGQLNQQINNQILMLHGAKSELDVWLKKLLEEERLEQERLEAEKQAAAVTPDNHQAA